MRRLVVFKFSLCFKKEFMLEKKILHFLFSIPAAKPTRLRLLPITRCQGTATKIGFFPIAAATARIALVLL